MWRILCFLVLTAVSGCVSPPPPEFAVYTAAFGQSREAAAAAIAIWEPIEKSQRPAQEGVFNPDEAAYIADEGRAGNAALIERGFNAVTAYNEILARYAAGESVSTIKPDIDVLAANVGALAVTVGAPGAGAAVAASLTGLEALVRALLAVSDRAEFARAVKDNAGKVDVFLGEVRAFTSDMYQGAATYYLSRAQELLRAGRREEAAKMAANTDTFRKMLASWVLTIDETRRALGALEDAVVSGEKGRIGLAQASYWVAELNRHAEAVKFSAREISKAI